MKNIVPGILKTVARTIAYGIIGGVIALVIVFVLYLENRPDLSVWHTAVLTAEFTTESPAKSFENYLEIEAKLFKQLDDRVLGRVDPEDRRLFNRFHRGSLSDPDRWSPNWNRTFQMPADTPKIGVLLLHGMSDSPYSLRNAGRRLNEAGAWVVGLRLPGHGTAPAGLVTVKWEDMAAAVRLAMRHLQDKVGDRPLYIVGYSNGGALAVDYALMSLEDTVLPPIEGIVLISPAIGVTAVAALAKWQAKLGRLIGRHKLAWNAILPEYDPFKYGSFAVNAGDQAYRLTKHIDSRLKVLEGTMALKRFPPVLAFQSVVDATVSTKAVVEGLFNRLPARGHELVLFDINRLRKIERLLKNDPDPFIKKIRRNTNLPFAFSLVTNKNEESRNIVVRRKVPGDSETTEIPLKTAWPKGLYSLSHIALPFPPGDPLYGRSEAFKSPGVHLGSFSLRGERGLLQIPATDMLRLRWNPFYAFMENRLFEFFRLKKNDFLSMGVIYQFSH
jgi:alpha-beta hydrolase superfamily lysophospholipase